MTSKLALYNDALLAIGARKLTSLTEGRATRRALDTVWDNGGVRTCLQSGLWNFAIRSVQIDYSPSVEPGFGYSRAFDKPTDWVRTAAFCSDAYFKQPLLHYQDEGSFWYSDLDTIYVQIVSDDVQWGGDLSLWSAGFATYAAHYFGWRIAKRITGSQSDEDAMAAKVKKLLLEAKSVDAMDEATKFQPPGSWTMARSGRGNFRRGRENG